MAGDVSEQPHTVVN